MRLFHYKLYTEWADLNYLVAALSLDKADNIIGIKDAKSRYSEITGKYEKVIQYVGEIIKEELDEGIVF